MQAYSCWRPPIRTVSYPDYNGNDISFTQDMRTGSFVSSYSRQLSVVYDINASVDNSCGNLSNT